MGMLSCILLEMFTIKWVKYDLNVFSIYDIDIYTTPSKRAFDLYNFFYFSLATFPYFPSHPIPSSQLVFLLIFSKIVVAATLTITTTATDK